LAVPRVTSDIIRLASPPCRRDEHGAGLQEDAGDGRSHVGPLGDEQHDAFGRNLAVGNGRGRGRGRHRHHGED